MPESSTPFLDNYEQLILNGYSPLPIRPGTKRPLPDEWETARTEVITPELIAVVAKRHSTAGVGVAGGFQQLVPIDIDAEGRVAAVIMAHLPLTRVGKRGQRGVTHFYRGKVAARKLKGADGSMLLEVLSSGQTVIPPTTHPDTASPYVWTTAGTLLTVPVEELPEITEAHLDAVAAALRPWMAKPQRPGGAAPPRARLIAYAQAALDREAAALAAMPKDSGRNVALFNAACKLGSFVHHGVLREANVKTALLGACETNGLVADDGWRACERSFASGMAKSAGDELRMPPGEEEPFRGKANGRADGPGPEPEPEPAQEQQHSKEKAQPESPPAAPLIARDVWEMLKGEPAPRCWHIEHWMPGDDVTGLFGDGGEGKTQLGLQLTYCTATGRPWLGLDLRPGPALYMSAEEPENELHYRFDQIARGIVVPDGALRHPLEIISRARDDALLCRFTRAGIIEPTPLWKELVERIGDLKPVLAGLDASADIYGGDEIDRAQVRAFIAMLRRTAIDHQCAILLMGHPSRDGMKTGLGYSGSTAWHNSMRARMYFTTPKGEEGGEPDPDLRVLSLEKSNRGRRGQKRTVRWDDGWFRVENGGVSDMLKLGEIKNRFMELLVAYTSQDRTVSHKPAARNYAPTAFASDKSGKHFSRDAYKAAMDALFADGRLGIEMWPPGVRQSRQSERLVAR